MIISVSRIRADLRELWHKKVTPNPWWVGGMGAALAGMLLLNSWLVTCGFEGCPSASEIRAFRPSQGGQILDRNGVLLGRLETVRRLNVPLATVPVFVQQAFIAVEDRRFYQHNGTDWRGFVRAFAQNMKSLGIREGFSTITMQAARNTFVVNQQRGRTLRQKTLELRLAKLMERSLTKQEILELYLNVIYMGNGVYGVEAASRDLFNKSVKNVTLPEAATLAALPKAPSYYTPRRSANRALTRRNLVLDLMVRQGYVSPDRLPGLKDTRIRIHGEGWYPDQSNDSYALDAVRALADSVIKGTRLDLSELTVYTSLDARAQRAADAAVRRRAASIGRTVEGAMVAIDPQTGDIRALSGGRRFKRGTFNRALYAKRQPGSAFKPFVYAAALTAGYSSATEVDDEPIRVHMQGQVWEPKNYDGNYLGRTTFRQALIHSANAATVRVSQVVGERRIIETAHKNGITAELQPIPSIALGALEVTPIELVTAYAPFANGGFRVRPRLVRRLEAGDGEIMYSQEVEREQVMDPRDAYQLTSMLRGAVDFGTGRALRDQGVRGMVAGKTGTTNNASDVWFIGYTPSIVAGFWFGFDEPRSMGSGAAGGRLAAPAWAEWYKGGWRETAGGDASWDPPDGMIMRVIDPTTGYLANQWCPNRQSEWFKPGTEPGAECPQHSEPIPVWEDDQMQGWEEVPEAIDSMGRSLGRKLRRIFRW